MRFLLFATTLSIALTSNICFATSLNAVCRAYTELVSHIKESHFDHFYHDTFQGSYFAARGYGSSVLFLCDKELSARSECIPITQPLYLEGNQNFVCDPHRAQEPLVEAASWAKSQVNNFVYRIAEYDVDKDTIYDRYFDTNRVRLRDPKSGSISISVPSFNKTNISHTRLGIWITKSIFDEYMSDHDLTREDIRRRHSSIFDRLKQEWILPLIDSKLAPELLHSRFDNYTKALDESREAGWKKFDIEQWSRSSFGI